MWRRATAFAGAGPSVGGVGGHSRPLTSVIDAGAVGGDTAPPPAVASRLRALGSRCIFRRRINHDRSRALDPQGADPVVPLGEGCRDGMMSTRAVARIASPVVAFALVALAMAAQAAAETFTADP